ncbi:hypothetical protein O7632_28705 [Solwaraspora sp. WMMD406]|uniref:hypothetical protein n=1 Tax=Solwaraspora sp. WMMD406 TaxID=3016095 RepID=UPI0024164C46|nr:hypothetical protein [Solwaraspora sp. WMMD406]MDG4768042.1 hypothetical protein [Solwaraspora sp. WMMD406]
MRKIKRSVSRAVEVDTTAGRPDQHRVRTSIFLMEGEGRMLALTLKIVTAAGTLLNGVAALIRALH